MTAAVHGVPGVKLPASTGDDLLRLGALGLGAWALATFHLDRLLALVHGGLATRLVLAGFGIAAALSLGYSENHDKSVEGVAGAAVWLVAQLMALRWAHPNAAPSKPLPTGSRRA